MNTNTGNMIAQEEQLITKLILKNFDHKINVKLILILIKTVLLVFTIAGTG